MLHHDHAFGFMPFERIHLNQAKRGFGALFCRMITSLILFIVSFPKSSLSSPSRFAGLFYCCSLLITVFTSLTVVNMWGGNERFRGHELRIRYYDLNYSRI